MPVQTTYPGIHLEDVPSGVRRISEVSTSVTAFVGFLKRGPMNQAVRVLSFADFERVFGGLDADSEVSYAVQQFFLNGGSEAWIVRTAANDLATMEDDPRTSSVTLKTEASADVLGTRAANPGEWGDGLQLDVDYDATSPGLFNLSVTEFVARDGQTVAVAAETFRNLSMSPASPAYVLDVVNDGSTLLVLEAAGATHDGTTQPPAQTGTKGGLDVSGLALDDLNMTITVDVTIGGTSIFAPDPPPTFSLVTDPTGTTAWRFRARFQAALRTVDQLDRATVELIGDRFRIRPGVSSARATIVFSGADANTLGLSSSAGAVENVQRYTLGGAAEAFQASPVAGTNGLRPGAAELAGSPTDKSGLFGLEDVDLFNILCIPRMATLDPNPAATLISAATDYCQQRRAFLLVDIPAATNTVEKMEAWMADNAPLRHKNAATYFPRVMIADPLNGFRLQARPVSGTLAGVYARTDSQRGLWKAPAGIDAGLRGVQSLEYKLTDAENGVLNPLGVNALRTFRDSGHVSWGARTMDGSDQRGSEWKYIPVRRTALFIEESLFRGTRWVVFEPNDESLWAQIRMNVGSFMQRLFQQGAFQGATPQEAFFVRCDGETTSQDDMDRGIVNILVGFAPVRPAEFVIIRIQQIADGNQE